MSVKVGNYVPRLNMSVRFDGSKYTKCIETKAAVGEVNVNKSNGGSLVELGMFKGMIIFGHSKLVDNP